MRLPILLLFSALAAFGGEPIPFEFRKGLILLSVSPGDDARPLTLVLDTGAEVSVLSDAAAGRLGLAVTGSEPVRKVSGLERARSLEPLELQVGGHAIRIDEPIALDLDGESRLLGRTIDGLLGADALRDAVLAVNFQSRTLVLDGVAAPLPEDVVVPLDSSGGVLRIAVECDRRRPGAETVRLDTGCAIGLLRPGTGRNGHTRFTLGTHPLRRVEVRYSRTLQFDGEHGLLGTGVLSRFATVIIDPAGGQLTLRPG